jgi:alkanesulfonate monooxygenase SsuD/methylene tetrahydromethanopterin reductase-like flavin-dependent oxidoreductase (luciferase family)
LKIAIGLPNPIPGTPGRLLVDWARRAEERGFSSLATIDRIAYPSYESLISLAAAAGVTERIGLITNVLLGPTRNPILLAKEAASVHQISDGRLILGVGVGGREDDFEAADADFGSRGRRWDDALEVMDKAWRGETVGGSPKPVTPTPAGGKGVPLLIGGMTDKAIERTVKWGMGWTSGGVPPDQVRPFVEQVHSAWKHAGREGAPHIAALVYFSLGEEVESESIGYLKDYYSFLGEWVDAMANGIPRTPGAVKQTVTAFADIGVDELVFDPTVADLSQVDRLAEVVL